MSRYKTIGRIVYYLQQLEDEDLEIILNELKEHLEVSTATNSLPLRHEPLDEDTRPEADREQSAASLEIENNFITEATDKAEDTEDSFLPQEQSIEPEFDYPSKSST